MPEFRSGIYAIAHKPTGATYVGQANHVDKRWREHMKQLKAGIHHNAGLQKLWSSGSVDDFEFRLLVTAPAGLSPLERQRWLVREERNYLQHYRERGTVVNEADPEIVPTKAALREYKEEVKVRERKHDEEIRMRRREIKRQISILEEAARPDEMRLAGLVNDYQARAQVLKNCTGWRRLFNSPPSGFDADAERHKQIVFEQEYKQLAPQVQKKRAEIEELHNEYRRLYQSFSKVANRRWASTCWYAIGRLPTRISIAE